MKISKQNQVHPPLPKKKRVDTLGNDRRRVFIKSGNASMLLFKGLTENGAKALMARINKMCENFNTKLEGSYIITK